MYTWEVTPPGVVTAAVVVLAVYTWESPPPGVVTATVAAGGGVVAESVGNNEAGGPCCPTVCVVPVFPSDT